MAVSYAPAWYHTQRGIVGHVLGGWNIAPLFTAQSGSPVGVYDGNQGSSGGSGGAAFGSVAAGGVSSFGTATYGSENALTTTPYIGGSSANYNVQAARAELAPTIRPE